VTSIIYDPACVDCRRDAHRFEAGTTWQCGGHVQRERDRLRAELAEARFQLDGLELVRQKDNAYLLAERDRALALLRRTSQLLNGQWAKSDKREALRSDIDALLGETEAK